MNVMQEGRLIMCLYFGLLLLLLLWWCSCKHRVFVMSTSFWVLLFQIETISCH